MTIRFTRRGFVAAGLGTVAASALAAPALAQGAGKISWRMQSLWDGGTTPQQYEERFVQLVGEKTDGNFELKLFSAGQIVPPANHSMRSGAVRSN